MAGGMQDSDIDQVLLVGGSSRIPKVQAILQEMFPDRELARRINPDEAIAIGAAMDASHQYQVWTRRLQSPFICLKISMHEIITSACVPCMCTSKMVSVVLRAKSAADALHDDPDHQLSTLTDFQGSPHCSLTCVCTF